MKNVIIALSVALMPNYGRLMCGQVLSVKQNDYILAGRAMGALRIISRGRKRVIMVGLDMVIQHHANQDNKGDGKVK